MHCSNCNRPMREPAGLYLGAPVGPTCLRRLTGARVRIRKADPVAIDQPDLFGECYFDAMGERDSIAIGAKHGIEN